MRVWDLAEEKILKKFSLVDEIISIKRRETHLNQKHIVKYVDTLHVPFYHFEEGELKTQEIPLEFPLWHRGSREKTLLG